MNTIKKENTIKVLPTINQQQFRDIVKGHFFSVEFIKANGELRKMSSARLGVTSKLRGGEDSTAHKPNIISVFESQSDTSYRKIDLTRLQQLKCSGVTYKINNQGQ